MIVICEPQCKGLSHEKVNEGLIYALRFAYPNESLRIYADQSHITALKNIFIFDDIQISNIEFRPITFKGPYGISGIFCYYNLFKTIFEEIIKDGIDRIFFLSIEPIFLHAIKLLKRKNLFRSMKFTAVLHGSFEHIADNDFKEIPRSNIPDQSLITKIKKLSFYTFFPKLFSFTIRRLLSIFTLVSIRYSTFFKKKYPFKAMVELEHSNDYHYIALSPHIIQNAKKYIDVQKMNIFPVEMPFVFVKQTLQPKNSFVKFAVFGFGNSGSLYNVANILSNKKIVSSYEIRIIGMDTWRLDEFQNIHCVSPGRLMLRKEMEKNAEDIDIFLILYRSDQYKLSCSASILEAISYVKPILHFTNDCINTFNAKENPIGFCCETLEEYAVKMIDIIENYSNYIPQLQIFRNNILKLREDLAIDKLAPKIKKSFTF